MLRMQMHSTAHDASALKVGKSKLRVGIQTGFACNLCSRASDFGLVKIDATGRITSFVEKPKGADLKSAVRPWTFSYRVALACSVTQAEKESQCHVAYNTKSCCKAELSIVRKSELTYVKCDPYLR